MTIRLGEIGKKLYVGMGIDLTSNTELTMNFKFINGNQSFSRNSSNGVTAPAANSPDLPVVGILPANTYLLYTTQAADFTLSGNWCVTGQYEDATPVLYVGDPATLVIESAC